jgi:chaperonin GroES
MIIRPLHDRVIIKREEQQEVMKGGIVIPDTAKEKPQKGEIIAAGQGKRTEDGILIALEVKKGDKVLFGKYSGTEYKSDDEDLIIMREDDILAVIE